MKKIMGFAFLLFSIMASAQNEAVEDTTALPTITEVGKPIGKIVAKMMNKDGGTLISEDGTVELIIPAGALSKKTTISIQTMTNTFKNGNGPSYRLEPSGIQFQQPVQIVFHYDPEESKDSAQLLMGIAMQDDSGQWYGLDEFTLDTIAKTISGNIDHFSIWATFDKLKLRTLTGEYRLKVKKSLTIGIWGVFADREEMKIRGLSKLKTMKRPNYVVWTVNGVIGGNAEVGTLAKFARAERDEEVRYNNYTAPNNLPDMNPVTISVELTWSITTKDGRYERISELTTNILIYDDDEYEVKMESVIRTTDEGQWGGAITITDEGSFIISLKDGMPYVKNIINKLEVYKDGCINIILNPTTCTGLLHVTGIKSFIVTPANSPSQPYPILEIWFTPYPMEFSSVKFDCPPPPGGTKHRSVGTHAMPAYGSAFPQSIKFIAKDGEQIIIDSSKDPGAAAEGYLKMWVQKLKDD